MTRTVHAGLRLGSSRMREGLIDTANSDVAPSVTGETVDGHGVSLSSVEQAELETLDDLLSSRGRYRLREMADVMKDSGALRIKDHRTIQGNNPDTFKGECVRMHDPQNPLRRAWQVNFTDRDQGCFAPQVRQRLDTEE